VYEKYTEKRYKRASLYTESEISKGFQLPYDTRESGSWHNSLFRRK
jgi:G2/mitotic-specific cyclin 3/4